MFAQWLVVLLWVFWLVVYWRGGLDILQDIRGANSRRDLLYLLILTFCTGCIVLNSVVMTLQAQTSALSYIGAIGVFLGVMGTFYCRHYLGTFWTAENAIQLDHQIIDKGPYGIVRHPIYTAAIILYAGTGLAFPVWWNVLFVMIVIVVYMLKTAHEDQFLLNKLPGYDVYKAKVPYRLIPMVW